MVVFFRGKCIIQLGFAAESTQPGAATPGPICQQAIDSGRGNYLANLVLFPGAVHGARLTFCVGSVYLSFFLACDVNVCHQSYIKFAVIRIVTASP